MIAEIKDWSRVLEIEPGIHNDDIYTIAVVYDSGAISFAYDNKEDYIRDYKHLLKEWRKNG